MRPESPAPSSLTECSTPGSDTEHRAHDAPRRRTLVVLLDYMNFLDWGYEAQLRAAFHAKCARDDLNVVLTYGRSVDDPNPACRVSNAIFDLVQPSSVDGVIAVSTSLGTHCGADGMARFLKRYAGMPLCSIGVEIPGVPSILSDNRMGMAAAVEHLIRDHGCRRIAFIGGPATNQEAQSRFQGYRETLQRHGLELDPALLATGNFQTDSGYTATERLLAQASAIDAVVAASDAMAFGAIDALRKHGHRVPRDLPVVGFDNLTMAGLANPPLTSVGQPYDALAELAVDLVLEQIAGRRVPECSSLPTGLVIRSSCGCKWRNAPAVTRPAADAGSRATDAAGYLRQHAERVCTELLTSLALGEATVDVPRLLDGLQFALDGRTDAFLATIEDLLEEFAEDSVRCRALQHAITWLREEFAPVRTPALDELWYEAMSRVALSSTTAQVQHQRWLGQEYQRLLSVGEQLSTVFDLESLKNTLIDILPRAGMPTAFVSRFSNAAATELTPLVSLLDGAALDPPGASFPARRLVAYPPERRHTSLAFPLTFETHCSGVAVFEYSPDTRGYDVIRDQISAALNTVGLHQEVVEKTMLHDRSVQERLATAKRMQSLSLLAGGVAHDLNNALGPLVALPDVIQRELEALDAERAASVQSDVQSIKSAALRAAATIKDLLTLGRQGRVTKKLVDLNQVVARSLDGEAVRFMNRENDGVKVSLDLCSERLIANLSEAHVARAVINLVRNAAEAIVADGEIVVRTQPARLTEPVTHYEPLPAGDYVVLTVSDTGTGIPREELGRLFEPYFSRKPLREHSGTGLGLAIVHGVVKEHEGFIDVTSGLGRGTTFSLYFPRAESVELPAEPKSLAPHGSASILVVDDDPIQLRTARRVLTHLGYRVDAVNSGESARELFAKAQASGTSPYDLVILDMMLNEKHDGLEVLEQIQRSFPAQKAIVASGHASTEQSEHAAVKGIAWLSKPYTMDTLARAVRSALVAGPSGNLRSVTAPPPSSQSRRKLAG